MAARKGGDPRTSKLLTIPSGEILVSNHKSVTGACGGVGFGRRSFRFVTLPAGYSVRWVGCATLHLPDGLMVSSRKPSLRDEPSPGAPRAGAPFWRGRLRSAPISYQRVAALPRALVQD
jgi:hypothetical protein